MNNFTSSIKVFFGANEFTNNSAVIAEFEYDKSTWPPENKNAISKKIEMVFTEVYSGISDQSEQLNIDNFESFITALTDHLLSVKALLETPSRIVQKEGKYYLIIDDFYNPNAIVSVFSIVFLFLNFLHNKENISFDKFYPQILQYLKNLYYQSPQRLISSMLNAAKNINLPIYPVDHSTFLYGYGQGKNSIIFDHGCSQYNSHIGGKFQKNKFVTTRILKTLGFPVTEQIAAFTLEECLSAAEKLGYPVVVKPPEETKGKGISTNIRNANKLRHAFQLAKKSTKDVVIVENHVDGDDHRINIVNGEIFFITKRMIPFIIGDGKSSIKSLIDAENERRISLEKDNLFYRKIKLDQELINFLNISGLTPEDVLPNGEKLPLREVANMSHGGTKEFIDPTDMHPDNHTMVKDLVKYFRLDSVGLDFITTDITKSWREAGSIVEINTSPMINEFMAEKFLLTSFNEKNQGRIDSLLVLSDNEEKAEKIYKDIKTKYECPAYISSDQISINDIDKNIGKESIRQKCVRTLLHPECDFVLVNLNIKHVLNKGLPIDRFSKIYIDNSFADDEYMLAKLEENSNKATTLQNWLKNHCDTCELI
ncbi:ATP-grasp domain-containing protein [Pseudemcibacter aquimaris]|uniref:ATP-grasp domain-containing protein n=1 Tax=Pseudemcibacter aquimaris TaxID=2857064 RepID=UPI00201105F9|nr:ATP-grasp domain-containing protein [Pseudemcibacter aquimaris]MCC3861147.1 ATP-grasp domain-containing protein [Pseudemcibacter aquimaris]WDU59964.1 ATP-grasp domain-containing protein [Pseudemcibacter aquimaris]